jgi:F-type H+-transporting ATPase subunit delta
MAEMTTVARPYARAAFEQAQANGALGQWSGLLQALTLIVTEPAMRAVLGNPKLSHSEKAQLLLSLCLEIQTESLPEMGSNFIELLAENQRLDVIPAITAIYEKLRADAEKSIHAELVTAFVVNDEQQSRIADALKKRLKRDVILECTLDKSLVGGAIIRAGDLVIDGSARGYLDKLTTALHQ